MSACLPASKARPSRTNVPAMRCLASLAAILVVTAMAAAVCAAEPAPRVPAPSAPHPPIGEGKGVYPGRVVWAHAPGIVQWKGPGDGHWWEGGRIDQQRVDRMMAEAVCQLAGEPTVAKSWAKLFAYNNRTRGRGDVGYKPGEKIAVKPNWVGMIFLEGHIDANTYRFKSRPDYMSTAPQMVIALLKQLTGEVGVKPADITVCDTLAYLTSEYYDILHGAFPEVRFEDYGGKFGRVQVKASKTPFYWSSRPQGKTQDFLPTCFAEADYLVNFANLKAHMGAGVTLCAKNHFGSLIRFPVQQGYYDIHANCFSKETKIYRPLVDLLGHGQLGGKTVLYLIDGLFSGVHPGDPAPRRMQSAPFNGDWPSSLFASCDPVAIDSVGIDFLQAEWTDYPRQGGVDDYLHEAAAAGNPPSGTFYDPNHATPTKRLTSLGTHEHWNDPVHKQYSRNLGKPEGIELVSVTVPSGK